MAHVTDLAENGLYAWPRTEDYTLKLALLQTGWHQVSQQILSNLLRNLPLSPTDYRDNNHLAQWLRLPLRWAVFCIYGRRCRGSGQG